MICRLCLKNETTELIGIFDLLGLELNMKDILAKYFWFEPKKDDPISTAVCNSCWLTVSNFHEYYVGVEESHRLLTERFSLKPDGSRKSTHSFIIGVKTITPDEEKEDFPLKTEKNAPPSTKQDLIEMVTTDNNQAATPESECNYQDEEETDNCPIPECDSTDTDGIEDFEESQPLDNIERNSLRRSSRFKPTASLTEISPSKITTKVVIPSKGNPTVKRQRGRPRKIPVEKVQSKIKRYSDEEADQAIAEYMQLVCDICSSPAPSMSQLRMHMKKEHGCRGYAMCCGKKFYKRGMLREHIGKHLDPEYFKCKECDKVFANRQCLRNHVLIKHQPDDVKTFVCEQCPKKFAKAYLLVHHRAIHVEEEVGCKFCEKSFANIRKLRSHIKMQHSNYGTMCDICAKVIRGRIAFQRHQQEHSGHLMPKVQCDICGSWHRDKYSLQKHKRRHNEAGIPHKCNICGKISTNRSAMLSHQRYMHKAERVYECGVCKKCFKKPIGLKEHMATHTGEVLYSCPHCSKTFNSNANMHSHRKKVHPKEFEAKRRSRLEQNSRQVIAPSIEKAVPSIESTAPQVITIKAGRDDEDTHILVTTEDFNDDDEEAGSIVFTVQ